MKDGILTFLKNGRYIAPLVANMQHEKVKDEELRNSFRWLQKFFHKKISDLGR